MAVHASLGPSVAQAGSIAYYWVPPAGYFNNPENWADPYGDPGIPGWDHDIGIIDNGGTCWVEEDAEPFYLHIAETHTTSTCTLEQSAGRMQTGFHCHIATGTNTKGQYILSGGELVTNGLVSIGGSYGQQAPSSGAQGAITVSGTGAHWQRGRMRIGNGYAGAAGSGTYTLMDEDSQLVVDCDILLGNDEGGSGLLDIRNGHVWHYEDVGQYVWVGAQGTGTLRIDNAASLAVYNLLVGSWYGRGTFLIASADVTVNIRD